MSTTPAARIIPSLESLRQALPSDALHSFTFAQLLWHHLFHDHPQRVRLRRLISAEVVHSLTVHLLPLLENQPNVAEQARVYVQCHKVPAYFYPQNRVLVMSAVLSTARRINRIRHEDTLARFQAEEKTRGGQEVTVRSLQFSLADQDKLLEKLAPQLAQLLIDVLKDSAFYKSLPGRWRSVLRWASNCCCCGAADEEEPPPDQPVTEESTGEVAPPIGAGDPDGTEPLPEPLPSVPAETIPASASEPAPTDGSAADTGAPRILELGNV